MNQKKKSTSTAIAFGIASVWFGTHMGPGLASGNQLVSFYLTFSKLGLFTGFIAMGLLGLCVYYAVEYARMNKLYDFKVWADRFYHPYEKFFSTFLEITFLATVAIVVGSCIATGAQALFQQFGWPIWVGKLLIAGITLLLTVFGSDIVRKASSVMTILILITMGIVIYAGMTSPASNLADHWNQVNMPPYVPKLSEVSLLPAIWSGLLYAGFQTAGIITATVTVSDGLETRKDSKKAAILGIIINAALIFAISLLIFSFPDVINEYFDPARTDKSFIPNLAIISRVGNPVLVYVYIVCLLLGIVSTLVGFAFAVNIRYSRFIPVKSIQMKEIITCIIMLIVCLLVSTFGLDAIVSKGYRYLAYACIVVIILPTIVIGYKKVGKTKADL